MTEAATHIFGIRHHGPGSARSLGLALQELRPDCLLVEGPPDAADLLHLAALEGMVAPVALLIHAADVPHLAAYFPFAEFSPEWQAIRYGLAQNVPVRMMDLPQVHQLALEQERLDQAASAEGAPESEPDLPSPEAGSDLRRDPLAALAEACGYSDSERWWDHMVESRSDTTGLFAAILEAMTALREKGDAATGDDEREVRREACREACMRQTLRAAKKEGYQRIAVVCGAWHAPALAALGPATKDAALLKGLPKVKVSCTWVPWTYNRLTFASGYGAGLVSPGWYEHLWQVRQGNLSSATAGIHWLTRVARVLRDEDFDVSSAHVIEAVRLAESLAAMRGRPLPGLSEFNEACRSVFCFGDALPLRLVHERLIVGERLGTVPPEAPAVPLQKDLESQQRRLRLPAQAVEKIYDLDLRKATDLERSHLLHRLRLLSIPWGERREASGKSGTFHEFWQVQWQPELSLAIIEAGIWGNTVADAAAALACDTAARARQLHDLAPMLETVLLADLPSAAVVVARRLGDLAAVAADTEQLMDALPPLARILRYGNVRQTDAAMVRHLVEGLAARIAIGLAGACAMLNDEAAAEMLARLEAVHGAIQLLEELPQRDEWLAALVALADLPNVHGLLAGRVCRLLTDGGRMDSAEASRRMGLALSTANDPAAAAWLQGFLRGSGLLLIHDARLWAVLDQWVTSLKPEVFTQLAPLLRRTFAEFAPPERRQIGEQVKRQAGPAAALAASPADLDETRAVKVLPVMAQLLGLSWPDAAGQGGPARGGDS